MALKRTVNLGALNATGFGDIDAEQYGSVSIQITGTFVGTLSFQVSNDGVNWHTKSLSPASTSAPATTHNAIGTFSGDIGARYFRVIMSAWTSGSAKVMVLFDRDNEVPNSVTVSGVVSVSSGSVTETPVAGSDYALTSAASTNAAVIKNAAGQIFNLTAANPTATAAYVKLYRKATAPTVGTDVPVLTIPVPAGGLVNLDFGHLGKRFTTGIAIAITGGPLATDTAAAVAGVQVHATFS